MSCKSAIYTADPSSTVLTLSTAAGTAIGCLGGIPFAKYGRTERGKDACN